MRHKNTLITSYHSRTVNSQKKSISLTMKSDINSPINLESNNKDTNRMIFFGMTSSQMGKAKRQIAKKYTNKPVEQLTEQITELKKQNNKLLEQVIQLRGRFQAKCKHDTIRGKQLDLQFQKQLYWGSSKTHIISGIKHQYNKLKLKFQEQKKQLDIFKKDQAKMKNQQLQIQNQVLLHQNKQLAEQIIRIKNSTNLFTTGAQSSIIASVVIVELEHKAKRLQQVIKEKQALLAQSEERLKQKENKILMLERLLIQKQNQVYQAGRKANKMNKISQEIKLKNNNLVDNIKQFRVQSQRQKRGIQEFYEMQKEEIRRQFEKQISQLNVKILKITEQKNQIEENLNRMKMNSSSLMNMMGSSAGKHHINDKKAIKKQSISGQLLKNQKNLKNQIEINNSQFFNGYESQQQSSASKKKKQKKVRTVMYTADKRNSVNSRKMRKIHYSQVSQVGQILKFKMLFAGISGDKIQAFFSSSAPQNSLFSHNSQWQNEHICMLEAKEILKRYPFNLNEENAALLSRYLIEDCEDDFVYCDQINQNKREIVKSIIKSLIGQYDLNDEKTEAELAQFKVKYLANFLSALKMYYPSGKVGKKKFEQILDSMGAELSQKAKNYILSRLIEQSSSLSELMYKQLEKWQKTA